MKKLFFALGIAAIFAASSVLLADTALNNKHKGKELNGAKVNCAYCHTKAKNPKTKGNDLAKLKADPLCKGSGCH